MVPTHKIQTTLRMLRQQKQFAAANVLEQVVEERNNLVRLLAESEMVKQADKPTGAEQ